MTKGAYVGVRIFEPHNLPNGYTQVEYIESSGTQYIDTGFKPNQNSRVVADFEPSAEYSAQAAVFGVRDETGTATQTLRFCLWIQSATTFRSDYFGSGANQTITVDSINSRFSVDKNKNVTTISGTTVTQNSSTGQCTQPLYIFTANDGGSTETGKFSSIKLYSLKIYDNGIIVRDYVPCVHSSGITGLYDVVNAKFYTNSGTGSFASGSSVDGVARKIKKGYVGVANFEKRELPAGYTQVEYIESSGTQYIDTGFNPNQDTRVTMVVKPAAYTKVSCFFGARSGTTASTPDAFVLMWRSSTSYRSDYFGLSQTIDIEDISEKTVEIDKNKNVTTVNGTEASLNASSGQCEYPMFLFAVNNIGEAYQFTSMKLFSCRVYDDGVIVRDYIPCKNTNGEAGLFDAVGNQFYANAGSGSFAASATVLSTARKIKKVYIGIGGVARPCWAGGELVYWGTAEGLRIYAQETSAVTVGNYALFGGGVTTSSNFVSAVDAYDRSLVKTILSSLSVPRAGMGTATIGSHALFAGGLAAGNNFKTTVDAYDESLVRSSPTSMSAYRSSLAAATIGDYALFGGGVAGSSTTDTVETYDKLLVRRTATSLGLSRGNLAATSSAYYALFGGGSTTANYSTNPHYFVDAFDSSLTRTTPTPLATYRSMLAATYTGEYAIFAGGYASYSGQTTVDAYDKYLTRIKPDYLSKGRYGLAATTLGDYAIFGGGYSSGGTYNVDVYDSSLARSTPAQLSDYRYFFEATTVGNFALFGGGTRSSGDVTNVVDVFTIK